MKPDLTKEEGIELNILMELFFKMFMTFCEYMNDTKGKVKTKKYAEFVIYALGKRLEEEYDGERIKKSSKQDT